MSATMAFVDRLKRHVVGESFVRRNPFYYERSRKLLDRLQGEMRLSIEVAQWLERTPRGKTPLIVHRPPVHDALRRAGVEPMLTH